MAFEGLSSRLQETIKKITGKGKVSEHSFPTRRSSDLKRTLTLKS